MKAKLIKKGDIYFLDELKVGGYTTIGNSLVKPKGILYDLSIKNCKAIERGYDLDELANEYDLDVIENVYGQVKAFKAGFQKAIEILGDKKYSEDDIGRAIIFGHDKSTEGVYLSRLPVTEFFQSLQQTEWDVEIEMEKVPVKMPGVMVFTKAPKLDADGCLILKRI